MLRFFCDKEEKADEEQQEIGKVMTVAKCDEGKVCQRDKILFII